MTPEPAEVPAHLALLREAWGSVRLAEQWLHHPAFPDGSVTREHLTTAGRQLEEAIVQCTAGAQSAPIAAAGGATLHVWDELEPPSWALALHLGIQTVPPSGRVTAAWVRAAAHHGGSFSRSQWLLLDEVGEYATGQRGRIIDLLALRQPPDPSWGALQRLALEIKVSRADFLGDIRTPLKQDAWRRLCHGHAFLAPAGLIRPEELPATSGLLEVFLEQTLSNGTELPVLRWTVPPPLLDPAGVPEWLLMQLAYRAAYADRIKHSRELTRPAPQELAAAWRPPTYEQIEELRATEGDPW